MRITNFISLFILVLALGACNGSNVTDGSKPSPTQPGPGPGPGPSGPSAVISGNTVLFQNSQASFSAGSSSGTGLNFSWTVTDPSGNPVTVNSSNVDINFATPSTGSYHVSLMVTDDQSDSDTTSVIVYVSTPPPAQGTSFTHIWLENLNGQTRNNVPVTFGQVFRRGDVPQTSTVNIRDGASLLPTQVDVKALHDDGSIRHAIISFTAPNLNGGEIRKFDIISSTSDVGNVALTPNFANHDLQVDLDFSTPQVSGPFYVAIPSDLTAKAEPWLSGPIVTEWILTGPVREQGTGNIHPNLQARIGLRRYSNGYVRYEVVMENTHVFGDNNGVGANTSTNYLYDVDIKLSVDNVFGTQFSEQNVTHRRFARWREVVWNQAAGKDIHVRHDINYLTTTGAIPRYNLDKNQVNPANASSYTDWPAEFDTKNRLDQIGLIYAAMGTTGSRRDIAMLPGWTVNYLLTMDDMQPTKNYDMKRAAFGTDSRAGSWSVHYRDRQTDQPVDVITRTNATILGDNDGLNKPLPGCGGGCTSFSISTAHHPSLAYVPYMLTGDYYYLEELLFWASYVAVEGNAGANYRDGDQVLVKWHSMRGQAWSLRTFSFATYIAPEGHPLKNYFATIVDNNLNWYLDKFVSPAGQFHNTLNIITQQRAVVYSGNTGYAPWMDDFFTQTIGFIQQMGFTQTGQSGAAKAKEVFDWKFVSILERLNVAPPGSNEFCYVYGSPYTLKVRDSGSSPFYTNYSQVWINTITGSEGMDCGSAQLQSHIEANFRSEGAAPGEMYGYPSSPDGYFAILRAAVAVGVQNGVPGALDAWNLMSGGTLPNYSSSSGYALAP